MPDDLSLTQTVAPVAPVVTATKPADHFTEWLYTLVVLFFMLFVVFMSHIHNDNLASKGMDFMYIVLGALTQASTGGAKKGST